MLQQFYKHCRDGFLDAVGSTLIIGLSLCYIIGGRGFAETRVSFYFLDFDIFIGEIVLFLCLILFFLKQDRHLRDFKHVCTGLWVYAFFIMFKTAVGYLQWGPLALRNAALFYYPVFALFGYAFLYRRDFHKAVKAGLFFALIGLFSFTSLNEVWIMTCALVLLSLIVKFPGKFGKAILFACLVGFLPYPGLFNTPRMMMLGNFATVVFLFFSLNCLFKAKKKVKMVVSSAFLMLIVFGGYWFVDRNALISLINVARIVEEYKFHSELFAARRKDFIEPELPKLKVFYPEETRHFEYLQPAPTKVKAGDTIAGENTVAFKVASFQGDETGLEPVAGKSSIERSLQGFSAVKREVSPFLQKEYSGKDIRFVQNDSPHAAEIEEIPYRNIDVAYANTMFRIFIWRDMIMEIYNEKPLFGFSFGKPLRPITLLVLGWAGVEFQRDGWIAAHNSFLHMLYRGGVVGLIFIGALIFFFVQAVKAFLKAGDVVGILLCGAIIGWLVAANFLLVFELPYTAIPVWFLFGTVLAFARGSGRKTAAFGEKHEAGI